MNHWQMIILAYTLTGAALALEVALLWRRRRNAWRQAQAWSEVDDDASAGSGAGLSSRGAGVVS